MSCSSPNHESLDLVVLFDNTSFLAPVRRGIFVHWFPRGFAFVLSRIEWMCGRSLSQKRPAPVPLLHAFAPIIRSQPLPRPMISTSSPNQGIKQDCAGGKKQTMSCESDVVNIEQRKYVAMRTPRASWLAHQFSQTCPPLFSRFLYRSLLWWIDWSMHRVPSDDDSYVRRFRRPSMLLSISRAVSGP